MGRRARDFHHVRTRTFVLMAFGHGSSYLCRNSLAYAAPALIADDKLNVTLTSVGLLTTVMPLAYGSSNLLTGILGESFSPVLLLSLALVGSAVCNVTFGVASSMLLFVLYWTLNGLFQGMSSPSCGRLLHAWFKSADSGMYWGLWAAAQNIGGFMVPLFVGTCSSQYGWRKAMQLAGAVVGLIGLVIPFFMWPSPESAGVGDHPDAPGLWEEDEVDNVEGDGGGLEEPLIVKRSTTGSRLASFRSYTEQRTSDSAAAAKAAAQIVARSVAASLAEEAAAGQAAATSVNGHVHADGGSASEPPGVEVQVDVDVTVATTPRTESPLLLCLRHPAIWLLALSYFCVYVLRQAATSWFMFYLMQEKGVKDAGDAALRVSSLELFGLLASIASGVASDALVRADKRGRFGAVGLRCVVSLAFTGVTALSVVAFWRCPRSPAMQWAAAGALGFGLYGPQNLVALSASELVEPHAVGTSQGLIGFVAYLGAASAGGPVAWVVQSRGWAAFFYLLLGTCVLLAAATVPLLGARSHAQVMERAARKRQAAAADAPAT